MLSSVFVEVGDVDVADGVEEAWKPRELPLWGS